MKRLRIGFLVSSRFAQTPGLVTAVMQALSDAGAVVDVIHPTQGALDLSVVRVEHDLYVLKKTSRLALSIAGALHAQGAAIVNPYPVTVALRDKIVTSRILQMAGVPTPATYVAGSRSHPVRSCARSRGAAAGLSASTSTASTSSRAKGSRTSWICAASRGAAASRTRRSCSPRTCCRRRSAPPGDSGCRWPEPKHDRASRERDQRAARTTGSLPRRAAGAWGGRAVRRSGAPAGRRRCITGHHRSRASAKGCLQAPSRRWIRPHARAQTPHPRYRAHRPPRRGALAAGTRSRRALPSTPGGCGAARRALGVARVRGPPFRDAR